MTSSSGWKDIGTKGIAPCWRHCDADWAQRQARYPICSPYVVPFVQRWNEDDIYMIASLFALHPSSISSGNIGDHLRRLLDDEASAEATERRFVQLLRARRDTLEPRLRQQVSILKSNDIAVNWHQLIADLRNWNHPDRFVQRRWAGAFWRANQSESNLE